MFIAVIPVKNEAPNLEQVILNLTANYLDLIIPVINGCTDNSLAVLESLNCPNLAPLCFKEALGFDVPRAVGAIAAREFSPEGVLFVDGDMTGADSCMLNNLVYAVRQRGMDLALTDCYPPTNSKYISPEANCLLKIRKQLNSNLGLLGEIGPATPSHGPHAISGRMLFQADSLDFAIPPMLLATAARKGLKIGLGAAIPHILLGSPDRSSAHARNIMETIIGDCLTVMEMMDGGPGRRFMNGRIYTGYHNQRRWDLLQAFAAGRIPGDCF